ncbi:MAG: hypothetical protein Q8J96_06920, partial [Rhodocyclaceae bacterium]|nr:hypothetical protein [Rhodocyclaceae bacterium]
RSISPVIDSFSAISRSQNARVNVISTGFTTPCRKGLTVNDFSCSGPANFDYPGALQTLRALQGQPPKN